MPQQILDWLGEQERRVQEAYQKGWDDATTALVEAARAKRSVGAGASPVSVPVIAQTSPKQATVMANREGRPTNRAAVIEALRAQPGQRPSEIPRWLERAGMPMNATSILTLVKRMKREGNIVNRDGRYFLSENSKEAAE